MATKKTSTTPSRTIAEGKTVFIRTATRSPSGTMVRGFIGTIRRIDAEKDGVPATVTLHPAAQAGNTGRFGEFLKNGTTSEMEAKPYFGHVKVPISSITDISPWDHEVPRVAV